MRFRLAVFSVCVLLFAAGALAQPAAHKRALLVGINDYTATHIPRFAGAPPAASMRDWPNLSGAVNDVNTLAEMLVLLYGFDRRDIVTITDQAATREAMLHGVEQQLVANAAQGDVLLFYYAGHGSQVRNTRSDEPDQLDESLVPADSRAGARDIRDKELRPLFNRILDRGARLTVILDNCHSGSGARGLPTGARPRGVKPDLRDIADDRNLGPRPESRGALVIAASQDFDTAWETMDREGKFHGAFSWAWMRAMRDASASEPAIDTFLRAQARLRAEMPFQEPVIAGDARARQQPFLSGRSDRRDERTIAAIEKVRADHTIVIQGGWATGLDEGSELRLIGSPAAAHLVVTAVRGLTHSEARVQSGAAMPLSMRSGALLEVVGWAASPGRSLRVWMPRVSADTASIAILARKFAAAAAARHLHWVTDPVEETPARVLRYTAERWELLDAEGHVAMSGSDAAAITAIATLPRGTSLFVQFPAPAALLDGLRLGGAVEPIHEPERADYILAGRFTANRIRYAWVRPYATRNRKSGLPPRSDWLASAARPLRDAVLALRRIHAWQSLQSPHESRSAYALELRHERGGNRVNDPVIGEQKYCFALVARGTTLPARIPPRYVYVFTIDSFGRSQLLFPRDGSVENRFPLANGVAPPREIALTHSTVTISPPYGVDTYFLLTTDEPIPNPWVLEWDGVRTRGELTTPLERLLAQVGAGGRSVTVTTPSTWSIDRLVCESIAPPARHKSTGAVSMSQRRMDGAVQIPEMAAVLRSRSVRRAVRPAREAGESRHLPLRDVQRRNRGPARRQAAVEITPPTQHRRTDPVAVARLRAAQ
jgi:hypothetical protein